MYVYNFAVIIEGHNQRTQSHIKLLVYKLQSLDFELNYEIWINELYYHLELQSDMLIYECLIMLSSRMDQ